MKLPDRVLQLVNVDALSDIWDALRSREHAQVDDVVVDGLRTEIEQHQEHLVSRRPILGSPQWYVDEIVSIDDSYYVVSLEDGHVMIFLIVRYHNGELTIVSEKE